MDDLKSVTVGYLRELARKHLGTGYSKMKKEELVAALAAYVPALAKLARLAGITVERKRSAAKKAAAAPEPRKAARTTDTPTRAGASKVATTSKGTAAKAPKESKAPVREVKAPKESKAPVREVKAPKESKAPVRGAKEPGAARPKAAGAVKTAEKVGQGRVSAPKRVAAKRASEKPDEAPSARPARVVTFPPKPRNNREQPAEASPTPVPAKAGAAGSGSGSGTPAPGAPATSQPKAPPPEQHAAEPLVEGFFVARVMGEGEARSHHLVGEPPRNAPPLEGGGGGGGGALPSEYGDDTALLLPRDPHTLFVSWDFSAASRNRAQQGLDAPRAVLRVFDSEKVVRELDVALEARSYYIHDLAPGRAYRVEAHFVGRDGRSRRIGPSTNRVMLPSTGPSQDTSVRFLRVPTRMPEPQVIPEAVAPPRPRAPEFEEREYITWRRVNLPGSAGVQDIPESRRERSGPGAPEAQPGAHLEAPPRPAGASDQRYLESMERPAGASDQRYLEAPPRPAGASDQRYLESPARAAGASDQRYLQGAGQPREHQYLEVGRAPGASDQRYLESPGRAPGASDQRYLTGVTPSSGAQYLDVGRAPGASDMRYLESPGRAPGASDMRYLESPGRAPGASDMRYLESPPRAPGASDQRYLEYVARPPGASDQRYSEAAPSPADSSQETPPRKPPSGSGRS